MFYICVINLFIKTKAFKKENVKYKKFLKMKKNETLPHTPTTIEWEIIDTPTVDQEEKLSFNRVIGDPDAPSFFTVIKSMMINFQKPLTAMKYRFHKMSGTFGKSSAVDWTNIFANKNIPWMKIGLVLFAGFILMKKDMHFNFNLSSPLAVFTDDDDNYSSHAQSVSNPYAPVSASSLSASDVQAFIKKYAPVAITEMEKYGIPASIKMGQALIESRSGTSRLAVNNNNFFGMKCFSKNCKKGHCSNATDDHHKDFFRVYSSVWESFRAHSILLEANRYAALKSYGKDYKKWAKGLKKAGYATDKKYDKKLINVIEKYKLYKYDS